MPGITASAWASRATVSWPSKLPELMGTVPTRWTMAESRGR